MKEIKLIQVQGSKSKLLTVTCKYCQKEAGMTVQTRNNYFQTNDPDRWDPSYIQANRSNPNYKGLSDEELAYGAENIVHNCLDGWFNRPYNIELLLTESTFDVSRETLEKYQYTIVKRNFKKNVQVLTTKGKISWFHNFSSSRFRKLLGNKELVRVHKIAASSRHGLEITVTERASNKTRTNFLFFDKNRTARIEFQSQELGGFYQGNDDYFISELAQKIGRSADDLITIYDDTDRTDQAEFMAIDNRELERIETMADSFKENMKVIDEALTQAEKSVTRWLTIVFAGIVIIIGSLVAYITNKLKGD